eukprot:6388754-Pyramimonas_sp.AAC.1
MILTVIAPNVGPTWSEAPDGHHDSDVVAVVSPVDYTTVHFTSPSGYGALSVSYTHLRAHETGAYL